jgi:HAD superfamily hydrolase (TIGR01484 family)
MTKKVLAFDMDDTLTKAKVAMSPQMGEVFRGLLDKYELAIISGAKLDTFLWQIVEPLGATAAQLAHLHIFAAQGTEYYKFDGNWQQVYSNPLPQTEIDAVFEALETAAKKLGYWVELSDDFIIEYRGGGQVTYSALGQHASLEDKRVWDPDHKKRLEIVAEAKKLLPEFEFEIGGTTSINAMKHGMNKVFGMTKLLEQLGVEMGEVLYFGDMTQPGGNDYPVVEMGFETISVRDPEETANVLRGILSTSD